MEERRVGLFGGSFDPPHVSHVLTVAWGLSACPLDAVWVIPVASHAFGKHMAPFDERVAMCERAFAIFGERVSVSTVERDLGGVNRTIDTVEHLISRHPDVRFSLLMGTDLFAQRERWKRFDDLRRLVPFHVIGRAGVEPPKDVAVGPPLPPVSSTDVRWRLATGAPLRGLVPIEVERYVRDRGLYSPPTDDSSQ